MSRSYIDALFDLLESKRADEEIKCTLYEKEVIYDAKTDSE